MRSIMSVVALAVLVFLAACGRGNQPSAPEAAEHPTEERATSTSTQETEAVNLAEYLRRANSDDAQSVEEAAFHAVARALVIQHVEPNKLAVGGQEFRVKRNPAGPGCFVYDPRTHFSGVERNLVWYVADETAAYALNSPSKMVTPALNWPRDAGIDAPSTSDVVAYVFRGETISSPPPSTQAQRPARDTFTVAEYRVYREVMDAPMSVSEDETTRRAATSHGVTATQAKTIIAKVQRILHANKWFGPAASEIRHASDWNGESR
jgi:hypothetical protein